MARGGEMVRWAVLRVIKCNIKVMCWIWQCDVCRYVLHKWRCHDKLFWMIRDDHGTAKVYE